MRGAKSFAVRLSEGCFVCWELMESQPLYAMNVYISAALWASHVTFVEI